MKGFNGIKSEAEHMYIIYCIFLSSPIASIRQNVVDIHEAVQMVEVIDFKPLASYRCRFTPYKRQIGLARQLS
jgi:hypothetical protein